MVKIGAINYESIKNVPPTELPLFRRFLINPKREIMEFPVSPDACLPSGLNLNAAHFLAGQYVDCQAIT